jgi:translation initiation factor 3 subunit E
MANFLGRIAPQLDNHLLLQVVDFYGGKGVNVADAKKTLIGRTKRFDLAENDSSEKAMADLQQNFTRLKNAALPLINKYFDDKQEEGLVMKISESEIRDIKTKGDQLSIRTIGVAEKTERIRDAEKMDVKQFREALVAEFGVSDDKKKVEIKNVNEMRKADESALRTTLTEVWYVYTQEFRGEVLENNFNAFLEMGQLLFETGSYRDAYEVLNFCRHVMDENHPKYTATLWGLLASTVLVPAWGAAEEALDQIRTNVTFDIADEDSTASPQDVTVRTRNWMLHWSLFVYFKGGESNSGKFLDVVFDTALRFHSREYNNLHTVETVSPHLLRYVVAACLMNRSKRSSLFHALKIVRACALDYSDALTQFLEVLIGQANFDEAFAQLSKVAAVIENDFFLSGLKQQIMDGALKLAYEFYIRTHKEVSIQQVAARLYPEEASNPATKADANAKSEMWIANLIRDAKVVAKIDSVGGKVDVYSNAVSVHQRIVDRMNQIPRPMMH